MCGKYIKEIKMELNVIWKYARTAALECCEGSVYEMEEPVGYL